MINGARGMVAAFAAPALRAVAGGFEKLTGKPLPALRPKRNYYRDPQFYIGNHRSVLADGETVRWPSFARVLDFELEIGIVLARPVRGCTPEEGPAAIGGFVVMNDWSARDTQWDDTRNGTFGGVVKAKTFAGAMSAVVVTADEVLPRIEQLTGRVFVNGERWVQSSTPAAQPWCRGGLRRSRGVARPGDVLSTGTLPGCCGLEMRRFPKAGDVVRLEIEGIGTLTNTIGQPW